MLHTDSWSHSHQRTCTVFFTHFTHSPRHGWLSAWVLNERPRGHKFYMKRILIIYECTLLHVFTGVESVPPCTSDLGVTIQIAFRYVQHGGDGEFKEVFLPNHAGERTVWWRGVKIDVILQWSEIGRNRMFPLLLPAQRTTWTNYPFPPWCVHAHFLGESLPMLWKREVASIQDALRPTAHPITEGTKPQETTIYLKAQSQLIPGDACVGWRLTRFKEKGR